MTETLDSTHRRMRTLLGRIRALAGPGGHERVLADLEAADRRLSEPVFKLVVLGEFKRGKSTLINALLGEPILPTGVVPLTSVVTEVRHGPAPEARIEFVGGESRAVPTGQLAAFVTEPGNPHNRLGVARAVVRHPGRLLAEGVTIVDTPGIGSAFEHNSEATHRFLEESDAVVMVLAADQPLSAEERGLLRALDGITDRIVFAVNRVDVLSPGEAESSLQFIRNALATLEERPPELVLPISARRATECRTRGAPVPDDFVRFEAALRRVLIERKSDILRERAATLARNAMDLLALGIESERRTLRLAGEELARASRQFESSLAGIDRRLEESGAVLKRRIEEIHGRELPRLADETHDRVATTLRPRLEAAIHSASGGPWIRMVDRLSDEIGRWVVDELREYPPRAEQHVSRSLATALEEHADRIRTAASDVVALANRLLGMHAAVPRPVPPAMDRPRFYLRAWDYSGGPLRGSRWRLWLPRRWAEASARELLNELLERRIRQNLGAVRSDWVLRLDDAVRRFEVAAREQYGSIVAVIREALERARSLSGGDPAGGRLSELDRALQEVAEIRDELADSFRAPPSSDPESRS